MITQGHKVKLSLKEYDALRLNTSENLWDHWSRNCPQNLDDLEWMGGKIVAIIEGVYIYVDNEDHVDFVISRIRTLVGREEAE